MNSLQVPSFDINSQRNDASTVQTPQTPKGGQKRPANFKRPTLIIPPPQTPTSPYTANITMPITAAGTPQNPHMYSRKASEFMFSQFNGIRDFTVSTAKSGLGIGEKCSFWLYNKVSAWSKKWFTHCFLTIVLVVYTIGGALLFVYVEGKICPCNSSVMRFNWMNFFFKVKVTIGRPKTIIHKMAHLLYF